MSYFLTIIELKFLILKDYKIFITIVVKICFGSLVMSFAKNKVFLVIKKDCVTASNARTKGSTRNVRLHPCHFTYDTHFKKLKVSILKVLLKGINFPNRFKIYSI